MWKPLSEAIAQCGGDVWLESKYGDKYNLKSALSQYVAMADLLRDKNGDLELFASHRGSGDPDALSVLWWTEPDRSASSA